MKNLYKIALPSLLALSMVGCADLDTEPMGTTLTVTQKEQAVANDPAKVEASVTAICSNFTVYGATDEDQHSDFGYPSIMMNFDSRGIDMVGTDLGYNWFRMALLYRDNLNTDDETGMYWKTLYNQIYAANAVTGTINPDVEDPILQFYLAQALAIRAFDYFTLAQMYQFTYVGNESALCVPLITEENATLVATEGVARSTVQEVYDFIMKDLDKAIELLTASYQTRADKRYVSLDVAYGIRARVNLVMNKWAAAASDAKSAIELTSSTPYSIDEVGKPGFIDIEDHSWMWGVLITDKDRVSTTGICNFPSHMGSLNYGYSSVGAWRMINKKLFNSIPETDIRRGWFLDDGGISVNLTEEQQAYATDNNVPAYAQVKYAPSKNELGSSDNDNDVPLMRVEEMYLIQAEALAMSGNPTEAAAILKSFVQTYRNPAYDLTAATAEEVQNAVWYQRRLELWGEGFSYFDLLRLKKGVNRLGGGFPAAAVFNLAADDPVLIYAIPHGEEETNKLIVNNTPTVSPSPIADVE